MTVILPTPARVRAIVVGIERYPGLGRDFDIPGAAVGALAFAHWLIHERGVPAAGVALWLSLCDGSTAKDACEKAGLEGVMAQEFNWTQFRDAMSSPTGPFVDGQLLMVYFCGHGVVSGARNDQHLVQPDATVSQFRCFEAQNWRELFRGGGWQRYGHQLWVIDACRNQWSAELAVNADKWTTPPPNDVRQCAMFACSTGGAAGIDSKAGPLFTRRLIERLCALGTGGSGWPAFETAFRDTAEQLRGDPRAAQYPTLAIAEDWNGDGMSGRGFAGPSLRRLLAGLPWAYKDFVPHVMGAQALAPFGLTVVPLDLDESINQLSALPTVSGVPPLIDFAERVARKASSPALKAWVKENLSTQAWAELDARFMANHGSVWLSLWYRDDTTTPCIEGELDVIEGGRGVRAWQRAEAKPTTRDTVGETIGQWVHSVFMQMGDPPPDLVLEIYLPRELLTVGALDTAEVSLGETETLSLGEDLAALLRCTDRYKGFVKKSRWRAHAPEILARLAQREVDPLQWATAADTATMLKGSFLANAGEAPIWLGFEPDICGGDAPLGAAIEVGLPAVIWLRSGNSAESIRGLRVGLQELLKSPVKQLPQRLLDWRSSFPDRAHTAMSLLLDDPAREPALLFPFTQPGGA